MRPRPVAAALALAWLWAGVAAAQQAPDPARGTLGFTFENDVFAGSDQDYTNGVRLDYVRPRGRLSALGRAARARLARLSPGADWRESFALGQNMYTPPDITLRNPPPDQRPYAGFLYAGYGLSADRGDRLDSFSIEIGVVGPSALAEPVQTFVHKLINSPIPNGWDTQIRDEPGIRLIYDRKYRFGAALPLPALDLQADAAPHFNLTLGNVDSSAAAGATLRIGRDLADDYGPPRVRPAVSSPGFFRATRGLSWQLFVGAEGRLVGRNIFLEGNTFGGPRGVTIRRTTADFLAGLAVQLGRVELAYTHVLRLEEYQEQDGPSQFGSLNLRVRY
ncbi:lipid A deacylase LpxR family protein [Oceanicella actignis]|uniref:lipid A deacylase LpxR family protein n=1 Tax=Oceanicella actignis TaxID=1189325 RepID=UPI0011E66710|nr:lipid A deacylase LpxR family protein [Oceanicella actignis]TYO89179.1 hypothetical protein LY05_01795 [Oceanicella actignis]